MFTATVRLRFRLLSALALALSALLSTTWLAGSAAAPAAALPSPPFPQDPSPVLGAPWNVAPRGRLAVRSRRRPLSPGRSGDFLHSLYAHNHRPVCLNGLNGEEET
ncbi:MAG: hypothetical protein FJ011_19205 [Chloroflexi bacterium]|nr:hypothetical protein [Chloroflexota bacterium]